MSFLQVAMLVSATALFVITGAFFIVRTMEPRRGVGWFVVASCLQFTIYASGVVFFGEESVAGLITFYCLQMATLQAVSIGMLLFIGHEINLRLKLPLLVSVTLSIIVLLNTSYQHVADYVFAIYSAVISFYTAVVIWRCERSTLLLKLSGGFLFLIGLHWLDFPVMSKVEWFAPMGFLLGLVLAVGLFLSLAAAAMLLFKTVIKDSERAARRAAIRDPLTGLYNRSYLDKLFEKYKKGADNGRGSFVLLYIDLDGFKEVNDTYGHKAGDAVLSVTAKRLKRWLGAKGDAVRIGGDELVVINKLRSDPNTDIVYGTSAAQAILGLLELPVVDGENSYKVSGSIGGCYYNATFSSVDEMLGKADQLMYSAKNSGGGQACFDDIPEVSVERPEPVQLAKMG